MNLISIQMAVKYKKWTRGEVITLCSYIIIKNIDYHMAELYRDHQRSTIRTLSRHSYRIWHLPTLTVQRCPQKNVKALTWRVEAKVLWSLFKNMFKQHEHNMLLTC